MKVLAVLSILLLATRIEAISRCELVNAVANSQLTQYASVADWVCLAYYESSYNTYAIDYDRNSNGQVWSADFGIFQINSYWWCYDGNLPNAANGCNINCDGTLTDNLQNSINCAAVVAQQQGMQAWYGWLNNCRGRPIQQFADGC
ncbi:lysozyme C, tracheal isozyme-like [Pristis pectinata]|uniref:lysozyme C, tracheal isozyme-like n=1 Tax=Pristis pectinata TaxID=685728 RepID=UPI00223D65F0|nr:lysozyme C, tracheal isozyme-like [Pristis pectinata]